LPIKPRPIMPTFVIALSLSEAMVYLKIFFIAVAVFFGRPG
jgi:hypothetical protein